VNKPAVILRYEKGTTVLCQDIQALSKHEPRNEKSEDQIRGIITLYEMALQNKTNAVILITFLLVRRCICLHPDTIPANAHERSTQAQRGSPAVPGGTDKEPLGQ
jgi:hypothetical protein